MTDRPDPRFEAYASREPYFAVLTAPKFLRANFTAEHEREFFASGEQLVEWMFDVIERRLSPHFSPMSTLEYGCGVGRLAIPFAGRPGSVTAVDRSPAMLATARREAARLGAGHIRFTTPKEFWASSTKFDLVSCFHVLQRMPPDEGLELLQSLTARIATGGIGVFHVPYRTSATGLVRVTRWAREHVPLVNGAGNFFRGRPIDDALIPSHTYDLDVVLRALDASSVASAHIVFEHQQELSSAIVFVEVPLPSITGVDERGRPLPGTKLPDVEPWKYAERPIEVRDLVSRASIDDLNRTAEQYFSSLADWEDQLTKPFSKPVDAPPLLANVATLLHGLRLFPGAAVLEFGAGSGWLSRCLTQLGCRVILADVSPTALRIARELYERMPVIGDRPAPQFLEFDGRQIALPDASVERVFCFDAFHHVANPDQVLREFGRILKPGGIAAFAEPGARHSRTPMSQFEMRTYAVVENDIDVHTMWRVARQVGFQDIKLAVFHGPPFYVSLAEYEDFLAGGQTGERWLTSTRVFQRDVRHVVLRKEGAEQADSRTVTGLACEIHAAALGQPTPEGQPVLIDATVTNTGTARWLAADVDYGGVKLGVHLYDESGAMLDFNFHSGPAAEPPREVEPGDTVRCTMALPPLRAGRYRVECDCVASRVTWFAQIGSRPATVSIQVVRTGDSVP